MGEEMDLKIEVPYQKFVLDNGLTLLVHEDHKAPIVAINVWYHVGSKNEKPGRTGLAHLFEHLMFNGSENFNDDYFQAMERIGATGLNGTTNEDRTNYFQNVPTPALDVALWMESDRMGHLLGAVTAAKLDEQRGVVQNEKRQHENEPYGMTEELIARSVFPAGHPYSWTVIGSMEDLNAASLEDVHEWFKAYYGAANAVIAIVGDTDPETAKVKIEKYFGHIPSGPPVARYDAWIVKRSGSLRQIIQDRVPQARIYKVWNAPQRGTEDADYLELLTDVLASGKTSRLYKRLVYDDQTATGVWSYLDAREIASLFFIVVTVKPGGDLNEVEAATDEELNKLLADGPIEIEVERIRMQHTAQFIRGIERIGGFGGKSDILAMNEVYFKYPEQFKVTLERIQKVSAGILHKTAQKWLSDGVYNLEVHPFPEYRTKPSAVDRSKLPEPDEPPEAMFPDIKRKILPNGLEIILAERPSVPVVICNLVVDAGYASDQFLIPGSARLAMEMLDEGTKTRSALEISEQLALLGAQLSTGSNLDMSYVTLSTLKTNMDSALDIFADVILNPSFPEADFNRLQKQQLAAIQREKVTPIRMALRVMPGILYGHDHAYGNPLTGSGTETSVSTITRTDLIKFHERIFISNNAKLIVVGATILDEIAPKIEKLFKAWKKGGIPQKNISRVAQKPKPVVYLIDRPGSIQSIIFAGHIAPPRSNPDEIAIETLNNILGGAFTSRINMNLREDKHWTYGASSFLYGARGQRPFIVYTSVQADKTKESMQEIKKELVQITTDKPVTEDELNKAKKNQTLELAGQWETMNAVNNSIGEIVRYGLPDNYFRNYAQKVLSLDEKYMVAAAQKLLFPNNIVWVVVADRSKTEAALREGNFGEIHLIDSDGNPL